MPRHSLFQTMTGHERPAWSTGTSIGAQPGAASRRCLPSIAIAIVAIFGCVRWVMNWPSAVTIIQRRSHSGPVGVMRKESTSIPRQDLTG